MLANGGFEQGMEGWLASGSKAKIVTVPKAQEGTNYFSIESGSLTRELDLPATHTALTLSYRATWINRLTVRVQSMDGEVLLSHKELFNGLKGSTAWQTAGLDLTPFAGMKVKVVWQVPLIDAGVSVWIDDVVVEEVPEAVSFVVYLQSSGAGPRKMGETVACIWPLEDLRPQSIYAWRVDAVTAAGVVQGPWWRFSTAFGDVPTRVSFGAIPGLVCMDKPLPLKLALTDDFGFSPSQNMESTVFTRLSASGNGAPAPKVVITELFWSSPSDAIEFQNPGTDEVNLARWSVQIFNGADGSIPSQTMVLPEGALLAPGAIFTIREGLPVDSPWPNLRARGVIDWGEANTFAAGVVLRDALSNVVDAVFVEQPNNGLFVKKHRGAVGPEDWRSNPVTNIAVNTSIQRIGKNDNNLASDWAAAAGSIGKPNTGITIPFGLGFGPIGFAPTGPFITGPVWFGEIHFSGPASNVVLRAVSTYAQRVITGSSNPFEITPSDRCLTVLAPASVVEGAGRMAGAVKVLLEQPSDTDLEVKLANNSGDRLQLPETVVIPAGATEASADLIVPDNALVDGPRLVTVSAKANGFAGASAPLFLDEDEKNSITFSATPQIYEGQFGLATIEAAVAPEVDVPLNLTVEPPGLITFDPPVLRAGGKATSFLIHAVQDRFITGPRTVRMTLEMGSWGRPSMVLTLMDDEKNNIVLFLAPALEGQTAEARLQLGGYVPNDLVVNLTSSNPGAAVVPAQVTVPAGTNNLRFMVSFPDNDRKEGSVSVLLTASATGFVSGTVNVVVEDNDPDHIALSAAPYSPWPIDDLLYIDYQLVNIAGHALTSDLSEAVLTLYDEQGEVPFVYENKASYGATFRVQRPTAGAHFHVQLGDMQGELISPPIWSVPRNVSQAVFSSARELIIACLETNEVVAIEYRTGVQHSFAPPLTNGTLLALSEDENALYAVVNGGARVSRADLNSFAVTDTWPFGEGDGEQLVADQLVGISENPAAVAVLRSRQSGTPFIGNYPSTYDLALLRSGAPPLTISAVDLAGTSMGASSDHSRIHIGRASVTQTYQIGPSALTKEDGFPGIGLPYKPGFKRGDQVFGDGLFVTPLGAVYDPAVPGLFGNLGTLVGKATTAFNKRSGHFAWLVEPGNGAAELHEYDSLTLRILPYTLVTEAGSNFPFLRSGGSHGWFTVVPGAISGGIPRFIPDPIALDTARADLSVTGSIEGNGSDLPSVLRVTVFNAGPDVAEDVRLSFAFPPDVKILRMTPAMGLIEGSPARNSFGLGILGAQQSREIAVELTASTPRDGVAAVYVGASTTDRDHRNNRLEARGKLRSAAPKAPHFTFSAERDLARLRFRLESLPGWAYRIESASAAEGPWDTISVAQKGTGITMDLESSWPSGPVAFYRLRVDAE